MTATDPNHQPLELDALEFELTDFSDAKQAMEQLPPGVTTAQTLVPGYWESRRRKPTATDRALSGAAIDWLLGLPANLRPTATCERYPRIVNAIAMSWPRPHERETLLAGLLADPHRPRTGFPAPVRIELEALQAAFRPTGR